MYSEEKHLISDATRRNWARLGADVQKKLKTRANKRLSDKRIIPKEYILCADTLSLVEKISESVHQNGWCIADVMASLCVLWLRACGQWAEKAFGEALGENIHLIDEILSLKLPVGEWDILGLIYQALLTEGEKNQAGAYYTPPTVVRDMVQGLPIKKGQNFLDPCCGSGSFLLGLLREGVPPEQIFGCDIDPIAVMIAQANLLCECGNKEVMSNVMCGDFLKDALPLPEQFDDILTNPPWGAMGKGESFSDFLRKGCERLAEEGTLRFLLPDSFLNVYTHRTVRRYLLEKECISKIRLYEKAFSGVTTGCIGVEVRHQGDGMIQLIGRGMDTRLNAQEILQDEDCIFSLMDDTDRSIFGKVRARGKHTLKDSLWALGIVTGDNKRHLKAQPSTGDEPIYTGREIQPYRLSAPRCYIHYDRTAFQQCARQEYYRATEKLLYKFISNRPVFALDTSGALCLNSANILIPRIEGLSIRTVMALLNSRLYQYLYMKQFGDVKILKGNLQRLTFPELSAAENQAIDAQVREMLNANEWEDETLQECIFEVFDLTQDEIMRILEITRGRKKS